MVVHELFHRNMNVKNLWNFLKKLMLVIVGSQFKKKKRFLEMIFCEFTFSQNRDCALLLQGVLICG